jgi:CRISPR-associated protein Cmr1
MVDSLAQYQSLLRNTFPQATVCDVLPPFTACSEYTRIGHLKKPVSDAKEAHKQAAGVFYQVRGMKAEVRGINKRGFGQPLPLKPMKKEYDQRRASPLFFHIHPVGNKFVCSHAFMPAQFLPSEGFDMDFYSGVNHYMNKLQEVKL